MMNPYINTSKQVVPMLYGYATPEVERHQGWTKIGYTEHDVEKRITQQTHTADIKWNLEWKGTAIFDDGSGVTFSDKQFHAYLRKLKIEQETGKNNEWFRVTGPESKQMFRDYRENHGLLSTEKAVIPYTLRDEQIRAVQMTADYMNEHDKTEFLWNAKPRFGKTLSVYDFAKKIGAETILIVTNRPAIANSWFSDYEQYLGTESGYLFVSEVDALRGKRGVLSRAEYVTAVNTSTTAKCIEFVSLQDMKGSTYFGGTYDKLKEIAAMEWDLLVTDESHEGVDTIKTDIAFDKIKRKFTLYLSGTPFKALANSKFEDRAIFNWTYADEQQAKANWDVTSEKENPYEYLPTLNLYTYQMSEIIKDELKEGIEINGETEEYAFDLNEFFSTKENASFTYSSSVDKFLDALTCQLKYPFSTPELRSELKHTLWLLDRVESAKALAKKLHDHPIFKEYEIVLAAGDGKQDADEVYEKSYNKVIEAISKHEKTITISVGQMTTGVTIPEWTAVLMLSNIKSPALYMQAAFRSQNPCLFKEGITYRRKKNAYVFDFDPARTLTIYEQFANNLDPSTAKGCGTEKERKNNIKELLNFFPVIGEDEEGELVSLDADKILTIPRKIRSKEVVKRGFMSNYLFQNISNVFGNPSEVLKILNKLTPSEEPKKINLPDEVQKDLQLNSDGEVSLNDEYVIGRTQDVFGEKIYRTDSELDTEMVAQIEILKNDENAGNVLKDSLKSLLKEKTKATVLEPVAQVYGTEIKQSDKNRIEARLNNESDRMVEKAVGSYEITKNTLEQEKKKALQNRFESGKSTAEIEEAFKKKQEEAAAKFQEEITGAINEFVKTSQEQTVKTVETNKKEREKATIEEGIRNHLRGFSRTIPSFLMAYGDDTVTLATFDSVIPNNVFLEVTSISLDEFKFLRDGGEYIEEETGEKKHFSGQLFDSVVFDDSVREFLALKRKLANYFDEKSVQDIFDYIPPQKTNQIFTPKTVVGKMVDLLEKENPGVFDAPDKTFMDLYMKSGLYIAEIVKRLYQSKELTKLFPGKEDRLKHIFEKQVYGLAPTEIIYKIAISFILGFDEEVKIQNHNFRQLDALPYAKDGTLESKLDEIYS